MPRSRGITRRRRFRRRGCGHCAAGSGRGHGAARGGCRRGRWGRDRTGRGRAVRMCRRRVARSGSTRGRCRALGTGGHARSARVPVCADTPRGSIDYTYSRVGVPCHTLVGTVPPRFGLATCAHVASRRSSRRDGGAVRAPCWGAFPGGSCGRIGGDRRIARYCVSSIPGVRSVWCNNARQAHDSLLAVGPGLVARPVLLAPAGLHFAVGPPRGPGGDETSASASETRAALGVSATAHAPALADRRIVLSTRE